MSDVRESGDVVERFVRSQITSIDRSPAQDHQPGVDALLVEKVGARSIAESIGLQPGDVLETVDGVAAANVNFGRMLEPDVVHEYRFHLPRSDEFLDLKVSGVPLGATFESTHQSIVRQYRAGRADENELVPLWEARDAENLFLAVVDEATPKSPGFLARLFGVTERVPEPSPVTLLYGAALCDLGRHEEGLPHVEAYHEVEGRWTSNLFGIVRYHLADELLRHGRRDEGLELMSEAFAYSESDRVADELAQLTGRRPAVHRPWEGEVFPVPYELPRLEESGEPVSLAAQLEAMEPHQLLVVIVLATYRANGPYNWMMARYRRLAAHLHPFLAGLHVITMEPDRYPDMPSWFRQEDVVRASGIPFVLLLEDGEVTGTIEPKGSPYVMLLSKSGRVVSTRRLDDEAIWNAIAEGVANG